MAWVNQSEDVNIYRAPVDGAGMPAKFIGSILRDQHANYLRDGRRIAFISDRSGSREIWIANADGSEQAQVTNFNGLFIRGLQVGSGRAAAGV